MANNQRKGTVSIRAPLTEGHLREIMMDDVVVRDTVQEKPALPAEEVPVHGGSSTTRIRPGLVAVVREFEVGVMQVGDHHEPVADPEPWDAVELHHVPDAVLHGGALEDAEHENHSEV